MGTGECTVMGTLQGASLYHWSIPDYVRMETDPFSVFFCGGGGARGLRMDSDQISVILNMVL